MAVLENSPAGEGAASARSGHLAIDRPRYVAVALWISALLFLFLAQRAFVYAPDDAFITYRYARNLADGFGPVFNPGAPVSDRAEGYSCPLYMLLMAITLKLPLGIDVLLRAKFLGLLCGLGTLAASQRLAAQLRLPFGAQAALPMLLAAHAGISVSSIDGMETILSALLMTLAALWFLRAFDPADGEKASAAGFLSALAFAGVALNRPEGLLIGLLALGTLLIGKRRTWGKKETGWVVALALPVLAWFLFRRAFYGIWLPNTYYAKMAPLEDALLKGAPYLLRTFFFFLNDSPVTMAIGGVWWLLVFAGAAAERIRKFPALVIPLMAAGQCVFVLRSGGDWMGGWRYMTAAVPILMLLAVAGVTEIAEAIGGKSASDQDAEAVSPMRRTLGQTVAGSVYAAILCAGLFGQTGFWNAPHDGYLSWASKGYSRNQKTLMQGWLLEKAVVIGDWLNARLPAGSIVAYSEMGVTPYLCPNLRFLDVDGLTDHGVATLPNVKHDQIGVRDDYIAMSGGVGPYLKNERKPDYIIRGTGVPKGQSPAPLPILEDAYRVEATFPIPTAIPDQDAYMIVWKRR